MRLTSVDDNVGEAFLASELKISLATPGTIKLESF